MPFNPFWVGNPSAIGQQTQAGQIIVAGAGSGVGRRAPKRRKKTRAVARKASKRVARAPRAKRARMVKGSAAAKAYMAKIRRKRR